MGEPGRSEWATTASITAVRGKPSGPCPTGVAWVSTTLPAPSPSTMRMTMVRGSGAGELRDHRDADAADPERHRHQETVGLFAGVDAPAVLSTSSWVNE